MTTIISYEQCKKNYEDFKNNLPEDQFARYYKELVMVRKLAKLAKTKGLEKDIFEYEKAEKEAAKILTEMGYKVSKW